MSTGLEAQAAPALLCPCARVGRSSRRPLPCSKRALGAASQAPTCTPPSTRAPLRLQEETRLKRDDWANFLVEGSICELLFYNGKVISVDPPQFVDLEIVECPPNVKGNTASGAAWPAPSGGALPRAGMSAVGGDCLLGRGDAGECGVRCRQPALLLVLLLWAALHARPSFCMGWATQCTPLHSLPPPLLPTQVLGPRPPPCPQAPSCRCPPS